MTKYSSIISFIALISVIAVFVTLYLPKTISNIDDLNNISCGWPMRFVEYSSHANPPLPFTKSCNSWFMGSPMDWNGEFLWVPFLTNVAIVFGIMSGLFYILQKMSKTDFR